MIGEGAFGQYWPMMWGWRDANLWLMQDKIGRSPTVRRMHVFPVELGVEGAPLALAELSYTDEHTTKRSQ